jgi:hypothetical protein
MAIADHGRASAPVFIAAALVAMGIAYVLLLAHPGLVHSVSSVWKGLPGASGAPGWTLPAVAAGLAIGGTALGVAALSMFVRGVQAHPFSWLAPVLIGFSTMVMTGIPVELPWSAVSFRVFTVLAGLTVLGGGAVMQMRGLWSIAAGTLLLLLPMLAMLAGYAAQPIGLQAALGQLDASAQLFLFVLSLTSVGIGFMAIVTERSAQDAALIAQHQHAHVAEALQRAAHAERRAQLAEQQLRSRGAVPWNVPTPAPVSEDEVAAFAALARPGLSPALVLGGALLAVAAVVAGLYVGLYRPLQKRATVQQAFVASAAKEHAAEIDALRKHFQAQQASLQAQLVVERSKTAQVAAPAEANAGAAPAVAAAAPEPEPEKAAAAKEPAPAAVAPAAAASKPAKAEQVAKPAAKAAEARRANARKASAARRAQRPKQVAAASAPPAPADDGEPELDRATRRALRESESMDDDPIGGLE